MTSPYDRFIRAVRAKFAQWRRGDHRVAPRATRGRIYGNPGTSAPGQISTRAQGGGIVSARIWVEAEQRWYTPDELRAKQAQFS